MIVLGWRLSMLYEIQRASSACKININIFIYRCDENNYNDPFKIIDVDIVKLYNKDIIFKDSESKFDVFKKQLTFIAFW